VRISTVLFIVGALALLLGVVIVAFGVPVSEFSFGNTLIVAGATTATGGLIVLALGAVTVQLQRLNDALAQVPLSMSGHEAYEALPAAAAAAAEAEEESHPFEPRGPSEPPEFPMPASPAPSLRNPEEPVEVAEDVPLSPPPTAEPEVKQPRDLPAWMRQRPAAPAAKEEPKRSFFDSVWPPESKMFARSEPEESAPPAETPVPTPEPPAAEQSPTEPVAAEPAEKPRAIAILKSGVVDGMGYTLYVDGSIEAELPQGTLRFASIHELRAHLEQNG
jgi:hypothetical protein